MKEWSHWNQPANEENCGLGWTKEGIGCLFEGFEVRSLWSRSAVSLRESVC